MRDFRRQPARGAKLLLARCELTRFFNGDARILRKDLQSVTGRSKKDQHHEAQQVGLGPDLARLVRVIVGAAHGLVHLRDVDVGHDHVQDSGHGKAGQHDEVEDDLDARDGKRDGVADDQPHEDPIEHAFKSARGHHGERRQKQRVQHAHDEDHALSPHQREAFGPQEINGHGHVDGEVADKEPLGEGNGQRDGQLRRCRRLAVPGREKNVSQQRDVKRLDGQDNIALDRLEPEQLARRVGRGRAKQILKARKCFGRELHGRRYAAGPAGQGDRRRSPPA